MKNLRFATLSDVRRARSDELARRTYPAQKKEKNISPGVIPNSVWLTLSPGTCPETRGSEPAPETSRNSWIGTCPGTFPEPVVRNVVRNLPGTCRSEPAPEPVVRNLPRNLPGTRGSEPGPDPEPSQNLSFGTCPGLPGTRDSGTFPGPVVRSLPRTEPPRSLYWQRPHS